MFEKLVASNRRRRRRRRAAAAAGILIMCLAGWLDGDEMAALEDVEPFDISVEHLYPLMHARHEASMEDAPGDRLPIFHIIRIYSLFI